MNIFKDYLKPVITLLVICIIVGAVLAAVNSVTAPRIEANELEAANATYYAALPEADTFTEMECDISGVTHVLKADNGSGYVITAASRGYNGDVPAAAAFSGEGTILRVIMMENSETPGMGQKVTESSFEDQFTGLKAEEITLEDIDAVSGATISSRAAVNAINLAIQAFNQVKEGGSR